MERALPKLGKWEEKLTRRKLSSNACHLLQHRINGSLVSLESMVDSRDGTRVEYSIILIVALNLRQSLLKIDLPSSSIELEERFGIV